MEGGDPTGSNGLAYALGAALTAFLMGVAWIAKVFGLPWKPKAEESASAKADLILHRLGVADVDRQEMKGDIKAMRAKVEQHGEFIAEIKGEMRARQSGERRTRSEDYHDNREDALKWKR